jgi:hypothetical protein
MRKTTIGALALVMMAAAPLRAQQHQHGHGTAAQPRDHAAMMMKHHAAHAALEHRQELGLSAEQVRRLTEVDSVQTRAMREHCARMQPAAGAQAQSHDPAMHQQMMASLDRFGERAISVLTAAQKAQLDSLHAAHHGPDGQHGSRAAQGSASGHGSHAAHGNASAAPAAGHAGHGNATAPAAGHAGHGNASAAGQHGGHDCSACCGQMKAGHGEHAGHTTG